MRRMAVWLWATCAFVASAQTGVLLETPVKIIFDARPNPDATTPTTILNLSINQDTHEFRLAVTQRGTRKEALAAQRLRTGWKDGYLFIRDDCLDEAEGKRIWRCTVDQVFAFVDGRDGKRLVHLGDVFAGEDCIDEAKVGCALFRETFTDVYDALENNTLISRAESPALLLEMFVVGGELVVDLNETWGRNQERFSAGQRCLTAHATDRAMACIEGITPRRAYLFNSVLATYTRRDEQLSKIRAFARNALCENKTRDDDKVENEKRENIKREDQSEADCSEVLRLSALMLAGIRPGARPRARGNVQSVPLPTSR